MLVAEQGLRPSHSPEIVGRDVSDRRRPSRRGLCRVQVSCRHFIRRRSIQRSAFGTGGGGQGSAARRHGPSVHGPGVVQAHPRLDGRHEHDSTVPELRQHLDGKQAVGSLRRTDLARARGGRNRILLLVQILRSTTASEQGCWYMHTVLVEYRPTFTPPPPYGQSLR